MASPPAPDFDRLAAMLAGFFDAAWYIRRYPDIAAAGVDPLQHFAMHGAAEGRDPNPWFDSTWYRRRYPDGAAAGMPPLLHYLTSGSSALRNPHPRFNAAWYAARHPDGAANPLVHYLRTGAAAGLPTEPPIRLGIGVITFNRMESLRTTLQAVRGLTQHDDVELVVADDGSADGTADMLRTLDVPVVTGPNRGVAWNKNRALYLLAQVRRCDVVVLLEDDTGPTRAGWQEAWIDAAIRWGHVSYAGPWLVPHFISGSGTPADPFMSSAVTAQCSCYSAAALDWGGYFDSRFLGFGYEHVEHTIRLIRAGYGGTNLPVDGRHEVRFALIGGGVTARTVASHEAPDQVARNQALAGSLLADHSHRAPWRDEAERDAFRMEIDAAVMAHPSGFALSRRP